MEVINIITSTRIIYNGKEENDELGLEWMGYGARNYDKWLGRWMNVDPLAEKYTNLSPFSYVANNVVNAIDPDGRLIIFIGGLRLDQGARDQSNYRNTVRTTGSAPGIYTGDVTSYWQNYEGSVNAFGQTANIDGLFKGFHKDNKALYLSGSSYWNSQASGRMDEGRQKAKNFYQLWKHGKLNLADGEAIRIVSHSQGGAHAAGFADQLMTYKDANGNSIFNVEVVYYITPHQGADILHPQGIQAFQFSHPNDAIAGEGFGLITLFNGGQHYGKISNIESANYFNDNIFGCEGQPDTTGTFGNRNGHNVTDNQQYIINMLNDFCKNNPGKCKEISLDPSGGND